jgi:hypothetical protein
LFPYPARPSAIEEQLLAQEMAKYRGEGLFNELDGSRKKRYEMIQQVFQACPERSEGSFLAPVKDFSKLRMREARTLNLEH